MNIELKLKFNTNSASTVQAEFKVSASLMLYPLYATEEDVLNPFDPIPETEREWVRRLIFNSSLTVYRETRLLESLKIISEDELNLMRRDYTICLTTLDLSKKFHIDYTSAVSISKKLGDFSAARSTQNSAAFLLKSIENASSCIREMRSLIKELESEKIRPKAFTKGAGNPLNTKASARLWWTSDMFPFSSDAYASWKHPHLNSMYKSALFSNLQYAPVQARNGLSPFRNDLYSSVALGVGAGLGSLIGGEIGEFI